MGLDPTKQAKDLIVSLDAAAVLALVQNSRGMFADAIQFDQGYDKHLTIALIETAERMTQEQFAQVFGAVQQLGVTNIATPFDARIPAPEGKRAVLHLTAQLRFENAEPVDEA